MVSFHPGLGRMCKASGIAERKCRLSFNQFEEYPAPFRSLSKLSSKGEECGIGSVLVFYMDIGNKSAGVVVGKVSTHVSIFLYLGWPLCARPPEIRRL